MCKNIEANLLFLCSVLLRNFPVCQEPPEIAIFYRPEIQKVIFKNLKLTFGIPKRYKNQMLFVGVNEFLGCASACCASMGDLAMACPLEPDYP